MTYSNPTRNVCVSIGNCPDWTYANLLSWKNVLLSKHANFYENDHCDHSSGFHFITDGGKPQGSFVFRTPTAIRSMMLADAVEPHHFVNSIKRRCFVRRHGKHQPDEYVESIQIDDDPVNATFEADSLVWEDLSSNWFEDLPNNNSSA